MAESSEQDIIKAVDVIQEKVYDEAAGEHSSASKNSPSTKVIPTIKASNRTRPSVSENSYKNIAPETESINNKIIATSVKPKPRKFHQKGEPLLTSRSTTIPYPMAQRNLSRKRSKSQLDIDSTKFAHRNATSQTHMERPKLVSTSSASSHTHRPGTVPQYLLKPNQLALTSSLSEKNRKFAIAKKQVTECQERFKQQFTELNELNAKVCKSGGKTIKLEKLHLVYLVPNEDGSVKTINGENNQLGTKSNEDPMEVFLGDDCISSQSISGNAMDMIAKQLHLNHQIQAKWYTDTVQNMTNFSNKISEISSLEEIPAQITTMTDEFYETQKEVDQMHSEERHKIEALIEQLRLLEECSENSPTVLANKKENISRHEIAENNELKFSKSIEQEVIVLKGKDERMDQSHTIDPELLELKNSEISKLKTDLANLHNESQSNEMQIHALNEELFSLRSQLTKLREEFRVNEDEVLVQKNEEISGLQKQLTDLQKSPSNERVDSLDKDVEISRLLLQISDLQVKLETYEQRENVKEYRDETLELERKYEHSQELLEESHRQAIQQIHQKYSDICEKCKTFETEVTDLRKIFAEREKLVAKLTSSCESSAKNSQVLRTQITQLEMERDAQTSEANETHEKLRTQNQNYEQLLIDFESFREEANIQQCSLVDSHEQHISQLNENFSALKDDFVRHKLEAIQKVSKLASDVSEREKEIAERTKEVAELTKNLSDAMVKCAQLNTNLSDIESIRVHLLSSVTKKQEQLDSLTAELSAESKSRSSSGMSASAGSECTVDETIAIQKQIQVLQAENERIQDEADALSGLRDQLRQLLESEMTRSKNLELASVKQQKQLKHKTVIIQKLESALELDSQKLAETQAECERLKQISEEQAVEISSLESRIADIRDQCSQHEETIAMHRRILRIRSQLIHAMRRKGESNRCRMVDLYAEIGKKSSIVSKMDFEISARAEEMQNLFSTLSTKQLEVSRQDQLIKMLEDCNAHNLRIRARQFERVTKLEKENSELKKQVLLGGADINVDGVMTPRSTDTAFNRKMFRDERRKRRREQCSLSRQKSTIPLSAADVSPKE